MDGSYFGFIIIELFVFGFGFLFYLPTLPFTAVLVVSRFVRLCVTELTLMPFCFADKGAVWFR